MQPTRCTPLWDRASWRQFTRSSSLTRSLRTGSRWYDRSRFPFNYGGKVFLEGFRADLLIEDKVIVELKSCETLLPVHGKQLLTQLRLSDRKLGFLINFGAVHLRHGIKRVVNGLPDDEEASREGRQGRKGGEEIEL